MITAEIYWTQQELAEASRMWKNHDPVKTIAAHFGVTPNAIYRMANRNRRLFPMRSLRLLPVSPRRTPAERIAA